MLTQIVFFLVFYFVSFFIAYKYVQIAHSKEGRWSNLDADNSDLMVTIIPVLNSFVMIVWLFISPYRNTKKKNKNGFFKIKRP